VADVGVDGVHRDREQGLKQLFAPPEALAHAVTPEAIADILVYLASDSAGPVSGAVVPAYGA
jgi:hypothetical protein